MGLPAHLLSWVLEVVAHVEEALAAGAVVVGRKATLESKERPRVGCMRFATEVIVVNKKPNTT